MEAFSYSNTTCRQAVLDFLDAWSAQLRYRGYLSGVYGSASSTIRAIVVAGVDARLRPAGPAVDRPLVQPALPADLLQRHERPRGPGHAVGGPPADPPVPRRAPGDLGRSHHQHRQQHRRRLRSPPAPSRPTGPSSPSAAGRSSTGWPAVRRSSRPPGSRSASRRRRSRRCRRASSTRCGPSHGPAPSSSGRARPHLPGQQGDRVVRAVLGPVRRAAAHGDRRPGRARQRRDRRRVEPPAQREADACDAPGRAPTARRAGRVRFTHAGGISSSAVKNYDVRWRRARWDGSFGDWTRPAGWQATTATGVTKGLSGGWTYCVQVRARNRAGQLSGWTGGRCLARALDDRRLTPSTGWTSRTGATYYQDTIRTTKQQGRHPDPHRRPGASGRRRRDHLPDVRQGRRPGRRPRIGTVDLRSTGYHRRRRCGCCLRFKREARDRHPEGALQRTARAGRRAGAQPAVSAGAAVAAPADATVVSSPRIRCRRDCP